MKERLAYVDILKGMAIFLVVVGHLIQANTQMSCHHPLFQFIYAFHMPLFMFITGYIGHKTLQITSAGNATNAVIKKTRSLLLPYFFWPLVVYTLFFTTEFPTNIGNKFLHLISGGFSPLWFLWFAFFLYLSYIVFLLISTKMKKKNSLIQDFFIISMLILFLVLMKYFKIPCLFDINSFLLYFLFFYSGIFVSKFDFISTFATNQTVFLIGCLTFIFLSGHYDYFDRGYLNKLIKIIISYAAIIVFYNISKQNIGNSIVGKGLQRYGKQSLAIYVTHFSLWYIIPGKAFIPENISLLYTILIIGTMSVVVTEACLIIKKMVSLVPYLNLLMYGEKLPSSIFEKRNEKKNE